jgi:hypothetical protein
LVSLGVAIVVVALYHLLVVGPRFAQQGTALTAHDALLGGAAGPATNRMDALDAAVATGLREREALGTRITALEKVAQSETPRVGFVRYNAFDDVGSDLSYALALLNKNGDGVVLSSIYSREDTRTYGKAVSGYQAAVDASREEQAAIAKAKAITS